MKQSFPHYDFSGRVALVSGGSSGIGLAVAQQLLRNNARVMLCGRDVQRGTVALASLNSLAGNARFVSADLSSVAGCRQAAAETMRKFGRIDILVNSAGQYLEKPFSEITEHEYDNIMNINSKGTFFLCQAALPELRKNRGCIVNVASDAGLNGNAQCSAYCASKGAVVLFTKALALECAPYTVRVNCVCPADVATPLFERQCAQSDHFDLQALRDLYPLGRIAEPSEIAQVVCFLASDAASFVTGAAWTVDGGITAY